MSRLQLSSSNETKRILILESKGRASLYLLAQLAILCICVLPGCTQLYGPFGYIDKTGNVVIEFEKYRAGPLAATIRSTRPPLQVSMLGDYSDGVAVANFSNRHGGTTGCVDLNGKLQIFDKGIKATAFSEGLASFRTIEDFRHFGYINKQGTIVIKQKYSAATDYSEGLAAVNNSPDSFNNFWIYIDKTGQQTIKQQFYAAGRFSQGLANVNIEGKEGAIDKSGKFIIPANYDKVYPASNGVVVARLGKVDKDTASVGQIDRFEFVYFDLKGKKLFTRIESFDHGQYFETEYELLPKQQLSPVHYRPVVQRQSRSFCEDLAVAKINSKYGYIDKQGRLIIPAIYDYAFAFSDGLAFVYSEADGKKLAVIDKRGKQITPYKFKGASPFSEGLAVVRENWPGLYGYIDKTGNFVISAQYIEAGPFHEGKARVGITGCVFGPNDE